MPDAGTAGMVAVALSVGCIHALDADHIMAVSALASRRPSPRECLRTAGAWALGHAMTLLVIASLPLLLADGLPDGFALWAERLVAVMLAVIGVLVLCDLVTRGARLSLHRHTAIAPHVHWVAADDAHPRDPQDAHGALMIGGLHGLAGSAPVLALLPAGARGDYIEAVFLLIVFSVGVLAVMFTFGLVLGRSLEHPRRLRWIRGAAGVGSVSLGLVIFCTSF